MSTYACPKKFPNILTFSVWNVNQATKDRKLHYTKQETFSVCNVNQATKDRKIHYKTMKKILKI